MSVYKKINGQLVEISGTTTFTSTQLDALNSGITAAKVAKIDNLPTTTELTGFLPQGQTTLMFTDAGITSNTIVDNILTSVYGVTPEDMTISNGSLTLTFDAQANDIGVKVVIR